MSIPQPRFRGSAWLLVAAVCLPFAVLGGAQDWHETAGGRYRESGATQPGSTGFVRVSGEQTGVRFTNSLSADRYVTNFLFLNGSGVALGDVDGDGWCDIFLAGISGHSALFRNLGGWKFEDITARARVGMEGLSVTGAVLADVDGDGDLDLIVNTFGQGTHLFLNDGQGVFTEKPKPLLNPGKAGLSMALADFDGNGTLDLYIANYRTSSIRDRPNTKFRIAQVNGKSVVIEVDGRPTTEPDLVGRFTLSPSGQIVENGEADVLYRNEGQGRFVPVPFTEGAFLDVGGKPLASPPYDWGLSVMFRDLNGDGAPDIYVCNDFESPDRIWINNGKGVFHALPELAIRHTSIFSMGVDVGDLNRDGWDDLLVSDMLMQKHSSRHLRTGDVPPVFARPGIIADRPQYSFNTLQLGRGDGTYAEIAWYAGVQASGWTWCPVLLDVDLDGYEDVLFTTGHEWDMMNADVINQAEALKAQRKLSPTEILRLRTMFGRFNTPNVILRNRGDLTFEDVSAPWGFTDAEVSQGIALADLDNDGDLDVVMNNLNGQAGLFRNNTTAPRVAVRLKGAPPNTRGIGAKILLHDGAVPLQSQEMISVGRYLSSDDPMRVFAAGTPTNRMRLEVRWRSGRRSLLTDIRANRIYEVDESAASPGQTPGTQDEGPHIMPWFEDVSALLKHTHHDAPFDDVTRQPLLPRNLSQLGPGVCWCDLDGDGWDDLAIGSGRGGSLAVYHNDGHGGFTLDSEPYLNRPLARDLAGLVGSEGTLIAGSSNYEDGLTNTGCLRLYDLRRKVAGDSIRGQPQSAGPLALADIDGDGDLDLFIGGRVVPGRYPEPADSLVLRNDGGRLVIGQRFEKLGLVSGAVFSDVNGDGKPDLIVACEWGPIRVFLNQGGQLVEATESLGLATFKGWWNGVTAGDFDGDGRMDIVAGNWGLNHRYRATPQHPRRVYYGDLDGDGVVDIIEATDDPETGLEVPDRGFRMVGMALPWVREKVGSYGAYGKASLTSIYGTEIKSAARLEATTLASMVFLNRGDHFEARELPAEAQWSPAFGIGVGDFDGDGHEDVFLSQNFFAVPPDEVRQDAGRGLWLRGDGHGGFRAVPGQESGVEIYGEQRGAALSDYDGDGRVDLAVTQNSNTTKLFHNVRAKPGLRVRLEGTPANRSGIGAVLRLKQGDSYGPAHEIHAGSGYWSQDSATLVLCGGEAPQTVQVRWPGGATTESMVPNGAREVVINPTGQLRVAR